MDILDTFNIRTFTALAVICLAFFANVSAQNKCALPEKLFGLTSEEGTLENKDRLFGAVKNFKDKTGVIPVVRIVFQFDDKSNREVQPEEYFETLKQLHGVDKENCSDRTAYVMGLLVDSYAVRHYINKTGDQSMPGKADRFYKALKDYVDIWEVGNELNGTWVGWKGSEEANSKSFDELERMRKDVSEQTAEVYRRLKTKIVWDNSRAKIALNLYLYDNECGTNCREPLANCGEDCSENYEMLQWSNRYLKPEDRNLKFDYVMFSYYEDDCSQEDMPVSNKTWLKTFSKLTNIFSFDKHIPKVGFGEVGKQCKCNRNIDDGDERKVCSGNCGSRQSDYVSKYYKDVHSNLVSERQNYIGGFFYWMFFQDATVGDSNSEKVFNTFVNVAKSRYWK